MKRFMSQAWGQTFNPLPILLSEDIGKRIRRKEPLPIDVIWTLYPAFRSLCAEFVEQNDTMWDTLLEDLIAQKTLRKNPEGEDFAEITQEQYIERKLQVHDLQHANAKLFKFKTIVEMKK